MLVSEGDSHSQRRVRSGLVVGHPQFSWRTRHPCTVDVLPGPTGVTSSPGWDEIKAPTLLVFGWVEVFVGSRGELVKSGVFLYSSVELQHPSSSKRVTSVGRLQLHLALEHPHQYSTTAAMTVHHDSYSPLATPDVRSSDTIYSFHRGQNECNRHIALFACSCPGILWHVFEWASRSYLCSGVTAAVLDLRGVPLSLQSLHDLRCCASQHDINQLFALNAHLGPSSLRWNRSSGWTWSLRQASAHRGSWSHNLNQA